MDVPPSWIRIPRWAILPIAHESIGTSTMKPQSAVQQQLRADFLCESP